MELLVLIAIGFALRGMAEHIKSNYRTSRDQRVKEVAKTHPNLAKSKRKAAARRHAVGWWGREVGQGFPVTRTGWHAAWLAHKAEAHAHDARREDARADAAEAEVARTYGVSGARQRMAAAQAELDAYEAELAARQAKGSPATGKSAVQSAADEVAARREKRHATGDKCPGCGAPDGYPCLPGCNPPAMRPDDHLDGSPPRPNNPLNGEPVGHQPGELADHLKAPMPDLRLNAAQRQRDEAGQRNLCAACGHPGTQADDLVIREGFRVHQSHTTDPASGYYEGPGTAYEAEVEAIRDGFDHVGCQECGQGLDAHTISPDSLGHAHVSCKADEDEPGPDSATWSPSSPTTQGAPVSDTNYTAVLAHADQAVTDADQDAVTAAKRRQTAEQHAEGMQAANVQGTCLSAQMELTELHKKAEEATKAVAEQAALVSNSLKKEHGGIQAAVDDAPIAQPAEPAFYGGS